MLIIRPPKSVLSPRSSSDTLWLNKKILKIVGTLSNGKLKKYCTKTDDVLSINLPTITCFLCYKFITSGWKYKQYALNIDECTGEEKTTKYILF